MTLIRKFYHGISSQNRQIFSEWLNLEKQSFNVISCHFQISMKFSKKTKDANIKIKKFIKYLEKYYYVTLKIEGD